MNDRYDKNRRNMSCLILKRKKEKVDKLVTLSKTRKITDDDIEIHAKWSLLKEWYEATESEEWVDKAIASVLNSIVNQERIYFCLEREKVRKLLKNDANRENRIGLDNNDYKYLIKELIERGFISLHDDSRKPYIFKVIEPEILEMIKIDSPEEQLKQVNEFVGKNPRFQGVKSSDGSSDGKTDVDNKKEVISKKKPENKNKNNQVNKVNEKDNTKWDFETFIRKQYEELSTFPFDKIDDLAQLVVENCKNPSDIGNFEMNIFEKLMKARCNFKITPDRKKNIKNIKDQFMERIRYYVAVVESENKEIKQPKQVQIKSIIEQNKNQELEQNRTLNTLMASFLPREIQRLRKKLEQDELDEQEKYETQQKIKFFERKIG